MADEEPRKSWWHTLPGILTSLTATVTALAGLVVAINQTNWFSKDEPDAGTAGTERGLDDEATRATEAIAAPPSAAGRPRADDAPAGTAPPAELEVDAGPAPGAGVTLPAMRSYTLGKSEFTLLDASLRPRNAETSALVLQVRLLNHLGYGVNFWDDQFRLLVDGVPRAPSSGLNRIVPAHAAEDGEITFAVPRSATNVVLRILFGSETTEIPMTLDHPR